VEYTPDVTGRACPACSNGAARTTTHDATTAR
jgi:hypothetical protein